jgi:hypothetical protein
LTTSRKLISEILPWGSMMKKLCLVVWAVSALALMTPVIHGQAVNATLLGTVTDSTGAGVPNAKIVATKKQYQYQQSAHESVFNELQL